MGCGALPQPIRSPGPWRRDARSRAPSPPPVEPGTGRKWVDSGGARFARVLPKVREHVDEGIPHFARGPQCSPVPPIGPQGPAPRQKVVHVTSDSDGNTANTTRKGTFVRGFDDQVQVIALHGELQDAEALRIAPRSATQSEPHSREHMLAAQRREPRTQRHMHGFGGLLRRPRSMRNIPAFRPLAPRPRARPAPAERKSKR